MKQYLESLTGMQIVSNIRRTFRGYQYMAINPIDDKKNVLDIFISNKNIKVLERMR